MTAIQISNHQCTGEIHTFGATVTAWQPRGQEAVLWLSPTSLFDGATPIRGGVPICLPWFGPGKTGDRTPPHGWARTAEWSLDAEDEVDGASRVALSLHRDGLSITYTVSMGSVLELVLAITNTGSEPQEIEQALHTYFTVGDASRVTVSGLDGAEYVDKTDGAARKLQGGDITFTGETDRVYLAAPDVVVDDPTLGRRLLVQSQGARNTVVEPRRGKSTAIADMPGRRMADHGVCRGGQRPRRCHRPQARRHPHDGPTHLIGLMRHNGARG